MVVHSDFLIKLFLLNLFTDLLCKEELSLFCYCHCSSDVQNHTFCQWEVSNWILCFLMCPHFSLSIFLFIAQLNVLDLLYACAYTYIHIASSFWYCQFKVPTLWKSKVLHFFFVFTLSCVENSGSQQYRCNNSFALSCHINKVLSELLN